MTKKFQLSNVTMNDHPEITLPVRGMHCQSCEILVEDALKEIPGVTRAKADFKNGTVRAAGTSDAAAVIRAVESCGYRVGAADDRPLVSSDRAVWGAVAAGLAAVSVGYVVLGRVPNFSAHLGGASGFGGALLVGLAAGFSSCIALVGGIVLSVGVRWAAAHPEAGPAKKASVHPLFNAGRVAGFAVGGAVLGAAGAALDLPESLAALEKDGEIRLFLRSASLPSLAKFDEAAAVQFADASKAPIPVVLGFSEARAMRAEGLFRNVGDALPGFFGNDAYVAGTLRRTGTALDVAHFVPESFTLPQ